MPLGYLRALNGLAQGQNQREQQDYERKQTETARQDRLQAAAAALMARQAETDYQRSRDAATDQRQGQQDLQKAYTDGYVPTEQLHTEGQQAQQAGSAMMAPGAATFDDTGIGTAITAAGMQAAKAPTMLTYANTALSKGRNSAAEQARYDNIEARKQDREAQIAGQTEAAKIAAQGRAEMARENMQGRKEIANMAASVRQQPGVRATLPTEGERKASAFYISGKQGYDTMESLLAGGPNGEAKAVPSWLGQQAAKVGMGAGNVLTNDQTRQLRQAANQMADAWLRYTSGAAVPEQEVQRFGESFIPAPGDDPTTLKQKAAARHTIMRALEQGAGRALPSAQQPQAPQSSAPSTRPPLGTFQR